MPIDWQVTGHYKIEHAGNNMVYIINRFTQQIGRLTELSEISEDNFDKLSICKNFSKAAACVGMSGRMLAISCFEAVCAGVPGLSVAGGSSSSPLALNAPAAQPALPPVPGPAAPNEQEKQPFAIADMFRTPTPKRRRNAAETESPTSGAHTSAAPGETPMSAAASPPDGELASEAMPPLASVTELAPPPSAEPDAEISKADYKPPL